MKEKQIFDKRRRDLDPAIWSLAREEGLGELRNVYHASQRHSSRQAVSLLFMLLSFCFFMPAITILSTSELYPALIFAIPCFVFLLIGVYLLLPRKIYARWHVYLWEAGFLYEKGQVRQAFRWDQIEQIQGSGGYSHQHGRTIINYKVRRQDGYEVKLNNTFLDIAQCIDIMLEEFSRQAAAQELSMVPPRDKTFAYQFKLDRQGISDKQEALSWEDIQELTIENGTMAVLKRRVGFSEHKWEGGQRSFTKG